ncbi:hypothetical protein K491DRAFT_671022 [Lophiostoma macrostomum CBS 122681]|uniref:Rhodopsin domain-containing protein n=1 Tax=Lophiostoma macrostomum CBS 122681 TaxID=1314788 RepID=A0A6A6SKE2_9PLEO|nr:hypothetical protein K491DRAFT_671022 [Lophiostoma macrostomum CBS 122681]
MAASVTRNLVPAMTPPPGLVSDFVHPPNHLHTFNIVAQTVCMCVAGILFILRCYVRLGFSFRQRQWILEDWMVCLSFIGLALYSSFMGVLMNSNAGIHQWNLTQEQAHRVFYLFWVESIMYGPFIFATKFSILLMYLRVFVARRRSCLHTTIWICTVISASFYIALTLAKIWQCKPIRKAYHKEMPGHCVNVGRVLQVSGSFNTVSDAVILLLPVQMIWNLQLDLRKKIAVWAVLTFGAVAPVFSALGFWCRMKAAESYDMTYNNPLILLWGTAEVSTGVICACLPSVYGLLNGRSKSRSSPSTPYHETLASTDRSCHRNGDRMHDSYFELDEEPKRNEKPKVVTTVRAGTSQADIGSDCDAIWMSRRSSLSVAVSESSHGGDERGGGIMKTVRIEQFNSSSQI